MTDTHPTGGTGDTCSTRLDGDGRRRYTLNGREQTVNTWAEELGASPRALRKRFDTHGTIEYDETRMGRKRKDGTRARNATPAQMVERKGRLYTIAKKIKPATVRQNYYKATVARVMTKAESDYEKVSDALADMRLAGKMPWDWIVDNTRTLVEPQVFANADEAHEHACHYYTQSFWRDLDCYVEFWTEKDTNFADLLFDYQVPLIVAHGNSSVTAIHDAAERFKGLRGKKIFLYHVGDHDQFGRTAYEKIIKGIRRDCSVPFIPVRLAVTDTQFDKLVRDGLTRPIKLGKNGGPSGESDRYITDYGHEVAELDAIDPQVMRRLVERTILSHLPAGHIEKMRRRGERERAKLKARR
jgi:hypothetical protein